MNNRNEILEKMDLDEEEYAQIKIVTNGIYLGFILFVVPSIMIFIDYLLHLHILATLIAVGVAYSLFSPMFLDMIAEIISGGKYALKDTSDNPKIVWDLITEAFSGRDCEDTPNKKKSPLRTAKRITIIFWGVIYILISLVLAILILAGLIYTIGGSLTNQLGNIKIFRLVRSGIHNRRYICYITNTNYSFYYSSYISTNF